MNDLVFEVITKPRVILALLAAVCAANDGRSDVSMLETKGPWSGSIGSSPSALGSPLEVPLVLVSAEVKINVKRGIGDELSADYAATFLIYDRRGTADGERDYLLAFPVTGMNSKIVTINNFSVRAYHDRNRPPAVSHHAIVISPLPGKSPNSLDPSGQMEGKLLEPNMFGSHSSPLPICSVVYQDAYIWHMKSSPGTTNEIHVRYSARLRPQSIQYSKAYSHELDNEIIPFDDNPATQWDKRYYFFDYVLISGSTWCGPIGRETVEVSIDPDLRNAVGGIESSIRSPAGMWGAGARRKLHDETYSESGDFANGYTVQYEVKGKPTSDLIFGIPTK
jgi:hypothetical protein